MALEMIPVWKQVTPALASELIAFWARNRALSDPTKAAERAAQAVLVGRDDDGQIWGVGTATLGIVPSFGQPTYLYRQFFGVEHRGQKQTMPFLVRARQVLEDYNASLADAESVGVMIELQNDAMSARYQDMYEQEPAAHFIGWSPRGHQLRMLYFKGAKIMVPPRPPAARPA